VKIIIIIIIMNGKIRLVATYTANNDTAML